MAAREHWTALAGLCRGRIELRDTYRRAAASWNSIQTGYAEEKARLAGQREAPTPPQAEITPPQAEIEPPQAEAKPPRAELKPPPAKPNPPQAEIGPPQAEPETRPVEDLDRNAKQKRRMITAIEQAAAGDNPRRFVEHVRLCEQAWIEIGPAGPDEATLSQAYHAAIAGYWRAAGGR